MLSIQEYASKTRPCQSDTDRNIDFFDEYYTRFRGTSPTLCLADLDQYTEGTSPLSNDSQLEIVLDVMGFSPENIAVRLEGNVLKVMAFYESNCDVNFPELIQHEIHNERLLHVFQLEASIASKEMKTNFENNKLYISMPL